MQLASIPATPEQRAEVAARAKADPAIQAAIRSAPDPDRDEGVVTAKARRDRLRAAAVAVAQELGRVRAVIGDTAAPSQGELKVRAVLLDVPELPPTDPAVVRFAAAARLAELQAEFSALELAAAAADAELSNARGSAIRARNVSVWQATAGPILGASLADVRRLVERIQQVADLSSMLSVVGYGPGRDQRLTALVVLAERGGLLNDRSPVSRLLAGLDVEQDDAPAEAAAVPA